MAIKWRKWKPAISFGAFFLGISLILGGALSLCGDFLGTGGWIGLREAFTGHYQDTQAFRECIYGYLSDFMEIACGNPPEWWNTESRTFAGTREEMLARYQDDKNLLYWISCDDGETYTNHPESYIGSPPRNLPEGYNFLLVYNNGVTEIYRDGQQQEIYTADSGYGNGGWWIPAQNAAEMEKYRGVVVCIAAAASPKSYPLDASVWELGPGCQLYELKNKLLAVRGNYVRNFACIGMGLLLLAVYIPRRRYKRFVDRRIARVTGRILLEAKGAAAAGALCLALFTGQIEKIGIMIQEEIFFIPEMLLPLVERNTGPLLLLFWTAYLLVNDLRYGRRPVRSLCARAAASIKAAQGRLPFQKRLRRRNGVVLACGAILAFVRISPVIRALPGSVIYDRALLPTYIIQLFAFSGLFSLMAYLLRKNRRTIEDSARLLRQIAAIRDGEMTLPLVLDNADLTEAARNLNEIQQGMNAALEERLKSERMKVELITNVSHDVKTPLTSIISYVELLKQEENLPAHVRDYIRILDNKSRRLKTMVQDVFEISKAASGQLPVKLETLDYGKLLRQTLADMASQIEAAPVTVKSDVPEEPVLIFADGQRLYRVFQNLVQNALQYSLKGSRVYITLNTAERNAVASVKNTSEMELAGDVDFTERFVRGDSSRADGGSGLGLSIARGFTEACGGRLSIETDADLFTALVEFPLANPITNMREEER